MRILAHIFSIFAFGLSSILTIQLLTGRTKDWLDASMMVLLGLVAEGGKALLFCYGIKEAKNQRYYSAVPILATAGFLIFLSILGTVSALNITENQFRLQEVQISLQGRTAQSMIARAQELRKEADELPEVYRTGKIRRRNEAWDLEQKAQNILKNEQTGTADQFNRIAAFLGILPATAQMLVYWGYGFALELIACLLAIMALADNKKQPANLEPQIHIVQNEPKPREKHTSNFSENKKNTLKKYIQEAHMGHRMLGFNKTSLSRSQWEDSVKTLYNAGLLKKNNIGLVPLKSTDEMLSWVG